jgi:hypothetical protein
MELIQFGRLLGICSLNILVKKDLKQHNLEGKNQLNIVPEEKYG